MKNKIIWILSIFVIILFVIFGYYFYHKNFCYTTVSSRDNSFSISIPNKVNFKFKDSSEDDYFLDFYSIKDNMFFYSNIIDKKAEINLVDVVNEEKNNLNSNFENVNVLSDVENFSFNNYNACKYSYTYKEPNLNKDLYAEVFWIETNSKIYVLDLEVSSEKIDKYKPIFDHIEYSFIENN